MKLLQDIRAFPAKHRRKLEGEFGIDSAESFFAHALSNPQGMAQALDVAPAQVERLLELVEAHLPADYRERCVKPVHRPRGLIVPAPRKRKAQ